MPISCCIKIEAKPISTKYTTEVTLKAKPISGGLFLHAGSISHGLQGEVTLQSHVPGTDEDFAFFTKKVICTSFPHSLNRQLIRASRAYQPAKISTKLKSIQIFLLSISEIDNGES